MKRISLVLAATLSLAACGEDKNYGAPIEDPNALSSAENAVTTASLLATADPSTGDPHLNALNTLSAHMNLLAGAKLEREYEQQYSLSSDTRNVDEACLTITDSSITYDACDFAGSMVDGTISWSDSNFQIALDFAQDLPEDGISTEISIDGDLDITDSAIAGFLDYKTDTTFDDVRVRARLDGDFDIVLSDGCAIGGQLEVHATANAQGQSADVWVKAEYGPACGDIVVR